MLIALYAKGVSKMSSTENKHTNNTAAFTQLLTPKDLSRIMQVKMHTVYRVLNSGELPVIKIGRHPRVDKQAFEKWLETNTTQ